MCLFDPPSVDLPESAQIAYVFRQRFVLQTLVDALTYAEDISGRILNLTELDNVDSIAREHAKDPHINKLWSSPHGTNDDIGDQTDELSGLFESLFPRTHQPSVFLNDFFQTSQAGFEKLHDSIFDKMSRNRKISEIRNTDTKWTGETSQTVSEFEIEIEGDIADHEYFTNQTGSAKVIERARVMAFLLPFMERKIWDTENSHTRPFHTLLRMNPFWRLLIFSWVFNHRRRFKESVSETDDPIAFEGIFGIPCCLMVLVQKITHDRVFFFGPMYQPLNEVRSLNLYLQRGIYLRYSFKAFRRWLEAEPPTEPTNEDVRSIFLRKGVTPLAAMVSSACVLSSAMKYLSEAIVDRSYIEDKIDDKQYGPLSGLASDDILKLGCWIAFLARQEESHRLFRSIGSTKKSNGYSMPLNACIGVGNNNDRRPVLISASYAKDFISIVAYPGRNPHSDDEFILIHNGVKEEEVIENYGDFIFVKCKNSPAVVKGLEGIHVSSLWQRYADGARDSLRLYTEFRVNILKEWLQRQVRSPDNWYTIANDACGLLFRLMRADLGVRIYRIAHMERGNQSTRLETIGKFVIDRRLADVNEKHDAAMRLIEGLSDRKARSLAYRTLDEDRLVLKTPIDPDMAVVDPYLNAIQNPPQTAMIMPIRMDHRVVGAIELIGSQKNHFQWSNQIILANVGNVLASALYQAQMVDAMRRMVANALNIDPQEEQPSGEGGKNQYQETCKALCDIFLVSNAHLWLKRQNEKGFFRLAGTTVKADYDLIPSHPIYGRAIDFSVVGPQSQLPRGDAPLTNYLLFSYLHGPDHNGSTPFLLFEYKDVNEVTVWNGADKKIELRSDWRRGGGELSDLREALISRGVSEILVFAIVDVEDVRVKPRRSDDDILGFVVLYHDKVHGFSVDWATTIELVNGQLVLALEHNAHLREAVGKSSELHKHRLKEDFGAISRRIKTHFARMTGLSQDLEKLSSYYRRARTALLDRVQRTFKVIEKDIDSEVIAILDDLFIEEDGSSQFSQESDSYGVGGVGGLTGPVFRRIENIRKSQGEIEEALVDAYEFLQDLDKKGVNMSSFEDVSIVDILNKVSVPQRTAFSKKRIVIKDSYSGKHLIWRTNQKDLERVFNIILDNAFKYAYPKSIFEIIIENGTVMFENNAPLDPSVTEASVFEKGFRGDLAKRFEKDGSGLGGYIAKQLCEASNLMIHFSQSDFLQTGNAVCRFTIYPKG